MGPIGSMAWINNDIVSATRFLLVSLRNRAFLFMGCPSCKEPAISGRISYLLLET